MINRKNHKKMINRNHQSIINGPPTGHPDIESTTFPLRAILRAILERSVKRVVDREPQKIRTLRLTPSLHLAP